MALCPTELAAQIEAIAARPGVSRARLGIQVETLDGTVLYSREGDRFFVPASTLKLLTSAAVLSHFGPDFQITTPVYRLSTESDLHDLLIVGQGDPSFDQEDMDSLAEQLAIAPGLPRIDTLWGDDLTFIGSAVNPNWDWEDIQAGYGAPVNALIFAENQLEFTLVPQTLGQPLQVVWTDPSQTGQWQIDNHSLTVAPTEPEFVTVGQDLGHPTLRVGGQLRVDTEPETTSIAVLDPGAVFLKRLASILAARAVPVSSTRLVTPTDAVPVRGEVLARIASPPLQSLLIPINQDSHNLYAEALLKQLGRHTNPEVEATTAGAAAVLRTLEPLGLDPETVVMVDGSGLARKNLLTPEAMTTVLQGMARSPHARAYRDSLAVAGISGTLRHRLQGTPLVGKFQGKSGALSRNFALAGYLETNTSDTLVVSLFLNNINERGSVARSLLDEILLEIARLEVCSPD
jgi:D-alanyl-D-alanine carboxypeptidase/D-alanyl-D-alanine-endopeptidase (penicillin-binding protein 4)